MSDDKAQKALHLGLSFLIAFAVGLVLTWGWTALIAILIAGLVIGGIGALRFTYQEWLYYGMPVLGFIMGVALALVLRY